MTRRLLIVSLIFLPLCYAPALAEDPTAHFEDAIACWGMADRHDRCGAGSSLSPMGGAVRFDVQLTGDSRQASIAAGGDGAVVQLTDAALLAGQGAGGELNLTGDSLTVLLRLANTGGDWNTTLFSKHGGHERLQYNLFCLGLPDDGGLDLGFELGTENRLAKVPAIIPPAQLAGWHTVIARYDGSKVELFFDGELKDTATITGRLRPGSDAPLVIGGEPVGEDIGRRFTGLIDHVAVWNKALADDAVAVLSGRETAAPYREAFRNQVHFSPRQNFMNDPNGMVYADGEYHLFYQHNPFGNQWGHMSWGHAVSRDMLHWQHLPVALREEDNIMIFSGSAVHDARNTSGFGSATQTPLVAIYSGHHTDKPLQTQNIAYSLDRGRTWTKYGGNPVIDIQAEAFRDPKVFWYAPDQRWVMVVALADQRKVRFYGSANLRDWTHLSDYGSAGASPVPNWECPELFELPVEGQPGASRWVLQIDVGDGAAVGGSGSQYFIGQFDGQRFVNENPPDEVRWVDHGSDFYAVQSFSGIPEADGRRVWIGWMNNWRYANIIPTYPWRGSMTIPREVRLKQTPDGIRLTQVPVRELSSLRGDPVRLGPLSFGPRDKPLVDVNLPKGAAEIVAEFRVNGAERFGLRLMEQGELHTAVGYDVRLREMFLDRRQSGQTNFMPEKGLFQHARLHIDKDDRVRLHVIVDRSSVELFGNDGLAVITSRIFPPPAARGVSLFTEQGDTQLVALAIYPLKSTWPSR